MYLWAKLDVVAFNYSTVTQTWENTEEYLQQLSKYQMDQLWKMYQSDFKAFGYFSPYAKNKAD